MSKKAEMAALREQRWTTQEARRVLAAVRDSGLSLAAFAREHDLRQQRLSWWRKRLGEWSVLASCAACWWNSNRSGSSPAPARTESLGANRVPHPG
jgi:transposase-like protein